MQLNRFRRQDGVVREAIKYFAIVVIFMVVILDAIAVIQAQIAVRNTASGAAGQARTSYVEGEDAAQAKEVASSYVEAKESRFISATLSETANRADVVVTVTAQRTTDTYVFHYLTKLPWGLGERVDDLLNPTATGSSE